MKLTLIAAVSTNRVIGVNNTLPWHLPADLAFFKEKTMGHHMLMGRRTWEGFKKPLPGRTSLVLSSVDLPLPEGVYGFRKVADALRFAEEAGEQELMVIGGGAIFSLLLPQADRLYISHIYTRIKDEEAVLFPPVSEREWEIKSSLFQRSDEKNPFHIEFMQLERKPRPIVL
jgi:dihydrofolate reductase